MKRTVLLVFLMVSACVAGPAGLVVPSEINSTRILVTVHLDRMADVSGAPSRIFTYSGAYGKFPRAQRLMHQLSREYSLSPLDVWPIKSLGVLCQVFTVQSQNASQIIEKLLHDSRVESVQIMNEFQTSMGSDPYLKLQTNMEQLAIEQAHKFSTGRDIRVAIIDTHVDVNHPELRNRIPIQRILLPAENATADRHGTAIAGVIAAHRNNNEGIIGVAPGALILALTACWAVPDARGRCNSFTLARALDFAILQQAHVINLSLSGPRDTLLARLVDQAQKSNIIVVGAMDPVHTNSFPCQIDGVLGVTMNATNREALVAPGNEVLSTIPGGGYDFFSGNSIATAHIAGIAALALEARPSLSAAELKQVLLQTRSASGQPNACLTLSALNPAWECKEQLAFTNPSSH